MTDVTGNLRASDVDREAVSERLRIAAGEGRISLEELDQRLERAYQSKTYAELDVLIADLPTNGVLASTDEPLVLKVRSGNAQQVGHWVVPRHITADCAWGNIKIDFTQATCAHSEVTLAATCGAGNILVIVPRGWSVRVEQVTTGMGSVVNKVTDAPRPGLPVLRVSGHVGMGNIKFKHPRR
ncbi:DUF1707 SHOCT-like domain-containing protein [Sphaerisporangium corydalis]|uniref:DUF1707 domain-containing protein n=1 Tax=Sphaerisporangium corydalis TaxID=1441875 RepID=A0ABV9EDH4_9ACTN|nr:DUF1707 domain-containing protein [Sphaerisporangium corydalis]